MKCMVASKCGSTSTTHLAKSRPGAAERVVVVESVGVIARGHQLLVEAVGPSGETFDDVRDLLAAMRTSTVSGMSDMTKPMRMEEKRWWAPASSGSDARAHVESDQGSHGGLAVVSSPRRADPSSRPRHSGHQVGARDTEGGSDGIDERLRIDGLQGQARLGASLDDGVLVQLPLGGVKEWVGRQDCRQIRREPTGAGNQSDPDHDLPGRPEGRHERVRHAAGRGGSRPLDLGDQSGRVSAERPRSAAA